MCNESVHTRGDIPIEHRSFLYSVIRCRRTSYLTAFESQLARPRTTTFCSSTALGCHESRTSIIQGYPSGIALASLCIEHEEGYFTQTSDCACLTRITAQAES